MADESDLTRTKNSTGNGVTVARPSPAAPTEPQFSCEVGARVGRYRLCSLLGDGGYGRVFLAQDEELGRPVAVKIPKLSRMLDADDLEACLGEARVAAQLDHPAIVPVYDSGTTPDGRCFVVSKYIQGTTLAERMRNGPVGRAEAARWITTLADALHHAHLRGVVHRDVKPGNVLLDAAGRVFLTDFGLALREEQVGSGPKFAGTVNYMSPEQARGEGHRVDCRSDVYSLCVVLYELLLHRRPFSGEDRKKLLQQVISDEPPAPRVLDRTLPAELERICLKGLSKRIGDRYATARELAEDLTAFLAEAGGDSSTAGPAAILPAAPPTAEFSSTSTERAVQIVPKGLRAYGPEDAEFFLDLLPGPRDRNGLPESVQFWKRRIETFDPDEAFAVGLMYGPSGCGKTSLVRAGLLPRLASRVSSVYCEADATDTASRMLHRVRLTCPDLPPELGLKESLAAIRCKPKLVPGGKLLLVLDQFEQFLHGQRPESRLELIDALRQCDGRTVACLILVRGDFWLAVSRFMRELETPLIEGQNCALVDVFDLQHAAKVLTALGRAMEALPAGPLDRQGRAFVEQAVAGLADADRVVCVRLAVFAQMMSGRRWTPATLRSAGGVQGIGVRFLEETFARAAAPAEYQLHEKAVRGVLQALLPDAASEIRGRVRGHAELLEASGYAARPAEFGRVLRILDREVRLITPVESVEPGEEAVPPRPEQIGYQLTHDFLVPSVRDWLQDRQSRTLRGRAELHLAQRTRQWEVHREARQLPYWWEWLRIRCLTRRSSWTEPQQRLMAATRRYYQWRVVVAVLLIAVASVAGAEAYGWFQANAAVRRLLTAKTLDIPEVVEELGAHRRWIQRLLLPALSDPDPDKQLRASLGLLSTDPAQAEYLGKRLLEAGPADFAVIAGALRPRERAAAEPFVQVLADPQRESGSRFRAAAALASWELVDRRWKEYAPDVAAWLIAEDSLLLGQWLEILRPAAGELIRPLREVHDFSDRPDIRHQVMVVLAEYLRDDPQRLLELSRVADRANLPTLARPLRRHAARVADGLRADLERPFPPESNSLDKDVLARARADAGLLLCLLGQPEPVWTYLAAAEDPRLRTSLVHGIGAAGVDPGPLIEQLARETDDSIRRAILWSLGGCQASVLTRRHRDGLVAVLLEIHRRDPDSGLHSAAEWLLRKWGYDDRLAALQEEAAARTLRPDRNWYCTSEGHTMAVFRGPISFWMGSRRTDPSARGEEEFRHQAIPRSFAIATCEVSLVQYRRFRPEHQRDRDDPRSLNSSVERVSLQMAREYCNWLTQREIGREDALCYTVAEDGSLQATPDSLTRLGYRLPTEAEWEYGCRAGTITGRHFGDSAEYLRFYAWHSVNSDGQACPGGKFLPNDLGLFDMYGNVHEWCHNSFERGPDSSVPAGPGLSWFTLRGGGHQQHLDALRSAARSGVSESAHFPHFGFRIARTVPPSSDEAADHPQAPPPPADAEGESDA